MKKGTFHLGTLHPAKMKRPLFQMRWVGVWMAAILAGVAASAADEPAISSLDYWPHEPGTTWVYTDEQGRQEVMRVAGQERLDDEMVTVVERTRSDEATAIRLYYAVREGQVRLMAQHIGATQHRISVPLVVWPATVALGTRWRSVPGNEHSPEQGIERREQISVPAGTYEALVISSHAGQGQAQFTVTQWRVRGVGLVRRVTERPDGSRQTTELVRYEPRPVSNRDDQGPQTPH